MGFKAVKKVPLAKPQERSEGAPRFEYNPPYGGSKPSKPRLN